MQESMIAEIVTFRTLPGVTSESVRTLAEGLAPFLAKAPGFVARGLSQAEDGGWTDYVLWRSLPEAMAAAEQIMAEPCAAPFMAAIDGDSVRMSHAPVLVRQTA